MNWDLMIVALLAGAANWAFRALPIMVQTDRLGALGWLDRFLSATGPAAIATLFAASILPALSSELAGLLPTITGTLAVLGVYFARHSVVLSTLAGAAVHGGTVWLMA
jgi:branched-subunit amino acid transport protein